LAALQTLSTTKSDPTTISLAAEWPQSLSELAEELGDDQIVEFSPALPYQGVFFLRTNQQGSC
jgi:hypothetical protein